jgi:hypothetical protein
MLHLLRESALPELHEILAISTIQIRNNILKLQRTTLRY